MTTQNMWQSTNPASVISGMTGDGLLTPVYGVLTSGTTTTNPVQVVVSTGGAGTILTSNGPGLLPSFQASGFVPGALVLIQTQSVANVASVIFNAGITTTYLDYLVCISNVTFSVNTGISINMDWSTNAGVSYLNSNYLTGAWINEDVFGIYTSTSTCLISPGAAYNYYSGEVWLSSLSSSTVNPAYNGQCTTRNNPPNGAPTVNFGPPIGTVHYPVFSAFAGSNTVAHTVNAIKFSCSSGNILTGTFSLYGFVQ